MINQNSISFLILYISYHLVFFTNKIIFLQINLNMFDMSD